VRLVRKIAEKGRAGSARPLEQLSTADQAEKLETMEFPVGGMEGTSQAYAAGVAEQGNSSRAALPLPSRATKATETTPWALTTPPCRGARAVQRGEAPAGRPALDARWARTGC
jgi:hypothetical protein